MRKTVGLVGLVAVLGLALPRQDAPASAASLGTKVLRGAAIGLAVKLAADPLNKAINTITFRNKVQTRLATKVVPILSVGEKGYVGGAQVAGPRWLVDTVQAVFEYEKNFSDSNYRAKIYLASASFNPLEFKRVEKVGVTALIDVALDGGLRYHSVGTGIRTGDAIRGAAVLAAVKMAGPTINKALNTVTFVKSGATAFVPMASIGEKAYLGGAQVGGASSTVHTVKAVWQYEDLFDNGRFRVRVPVPVTALNPLEAKRADGVGLTAVVDMALSEQRPAEARRDKFNAGSIFGFPLGHDEDAGDRDRHREQQVVPARHDNGKHRGWWKGKHKGWDKQRGGDGRDDD